MHTPKASRKSSMESSQRTPSSETSQKVSPSTNRTARQLKVAGDSTGSPNPSSRIPKNRSPKVLDCGSPRSPITERKRPAKLSELESQLAQLEDELKRAKDQLSSSEALKRHAQQEAEETKRQLSDTSARLEESQQQLLELSTCDDDRVQELRKLSQERDRAWQSELEAVQNQHSMDSQALASALNEIQKLKRKLEMVAESEKTAQGEIQSLREEISETHLLVENMKNLLNESKGSETRALEVAREAQMQLESAMASEASLRSEGLKAMEAYNGLASELEQSKAQVSSLESLVSKLQDDLENGTQNSSDPSKEIMPKQDGEGLKTEIESLKLEVVQLKSMLAASELRYQEEYIQSTLQIRNAYDLVERAKSESSAKEAELEAELKKSRATIEELKSELISKQNILQDTTENKNEMNIKFELENELKELKEDLMDLKEALLDKETQFQNTREENERLKSEILKHEKERIEGIESAKAAEREAMMKLSYMTEEAEKSSQRAARVADQLDAAQKANTELEAELRRLKVQSDQWRKAAEAAANMLSSTEGNGKFVDRTISLDGNYNTKMESPLSDDDMDDDDSQKKKNGNMLKKFGGLWKKGQK